MIRAFVSMLASIVTLALLLIVYEYCFFREQAAYLLVMQQQYCSYKMLYEKRLLCLQEVDKRLKPIEVVTKKQDEGPPVGTSNCPIINTVSGITIESPLKKVAYDKTAQRRKTGIRPPLKKLLFIWPVERSKFWLSSLFGLRKMSRMTSKFHYGIDLAASKGTEVVAAAAGVVTHARNAPGYGNMIHIVHEGLYETRYAHLDTIGVCEHQLVKSGELIGTVGDTGFTMKKGTDASHLHFEVHCQGKQVNPLLFLPS